MISGKWSIEIGRADGTVDVIECDSEAEARARYAQVISEQRLMKKEEPR